MAYGMNRSSSKFTPLSDEDEDDFANFSIGNESPAHARNGSDGDQTGHLYASHQSTAGMRAAQQERQSVPPAQPNRGSVFGTAYANASQRSGQNQAASQDTLQAIKAKSASLAGFIRDKATQAGTSIADPEARQSTISRFKLWGAGAAERVSSTAEKGWQSARELTAEGMKRFYGGPLETICKQENSQRPCPRTILVLCTALCTNGLFTEGIFKEDAPSELVYYLLGALQEGQGLVLPPAGTDPLVIASAIKQFLMTLPEPLLTFKGVTALVACGRSSPPRDVQGALGELPAASLNALFLLLETWHRVAENSHTNGMDAMAIAVAMAPCVAWNPPPTADNRKGYQTIGVPVVQEGSWRKGAAYSSGPDTAATEFSEAGAMAHSDIPPEDLTALIAVLEYAILNFKGQGSDFDGPLYDVASPLSHQSSNTSSMAVNIDRSELAAGSHKSLSVGRTDRSAVPPGSGQGSSVEKREGASSVSSRAPSSPPPKESLI